MYRARRVVMRIGLPNYSGHWARERPRRWGPARLARWPLQPSYRVPSATSHRIRFALGPLLWRELALAYSVQQIEKASLCSNVLVWQSTCTRFLRTGAGFPLQEAQG